MCYLKQNGKVNTSVNTHMHSLISNILYFIIPHMFFSLVIVKVQQLGVCDSESCSCCR